MEALNRVRALDLQMELQREYSKAEWRKAIQDNRARFLANGGKIERVIATAKPRKMRAYWEF